MPARVPKISTRSIARSLDDLYESQGEAVDELSAAERRARALGESAGTERERLGETYPALDGRRQP